MIKRRWLLYLLLAAAVIGLANSAQAQGTPPATATPTPDFVVARVYYADRAQLLELTGRYDVWEVNAAEGYALIGLTRAEYAALLGRGFRVSIDLVKTIEANRPRVALPGQINGIPGYACYRTVEETFATGQAIAVAHPDLAEWIDIGDSWEKVASGGVGGYDLMVLRLTNEAIPGPKPVFFSMSSVHAREYAPAELNTRFAEYLINNYGTDPDVTWLLDFNEVHLLLQANPDGRKQAEAGLLWRKNTNQNYCSPTSTSRGADLNRNWPFMWNSCLGCSSGNQCDLTYRGPSAASEPETQSTVAYVQSIFPDYRPVDDLTTPVPITATGMFFDLHSYSELVLWSWGFTSNPAPNGTALQTLGRKLAYFNNYDPGQSVELYPTDGTTDDTAYGQLGVPAYTIEMGTSFFQDCASFESTIYPTNLNALVYALKATHKPYVAPAGPEVLNLTAAPTTTLQGAHVVLAATANDTRYLEGEPTQAIAAARYSIDLPSWRGGTTYPLSAADGAFNASIEAITGTVDTAGLSLGRHTLFVEAQDAAGNWGVPTAVFVDVQGVPNSALTGHVLTQGSGAPVADAQIVASAGPTMTFSTLSGADGAYHVAVLAGNYTLTASKYGYEATTINSITTSAGVTTTQDITLTTVPFYTVSGVVRDAQTGWPVAAAINIGGYPHGPISNSPVTGAYSLSLASDITYTFSISPLVPGYLPQTRAVGPLIADRVEDFYLNIDADACVAPGYAFAGVYQAFDSLTPPPGWQVINNVGSAGWSFNNPGGRSNLTGGAGGFAIADSDHAGSGVSMNTELRTPVMDLSALSAVTLTFKTDFRYYTGSLAEVADVDVSVNGAAGPWTNVWRKTTDYRGPKTETLDLTALAAGQANVMVRFHYYNAVFEWWWQVDEVRIGSCTVVQAGVPLLTPAAAEKTGLPGETLTYTLSMSNTGNFTDTFTVSATGHLFPTSWWPPTATLAAGAGRDLIVTVTIPLTASNGSSDTVQIGLTGATLSANSALTTRVLWPYGIYLPVLRHGDLPEAQE